MKNAQIFLLLTTVCCLVSFGCDSKKIKTYDCTGTVTLDGEPVENANVAFINVKHSSPAATRTDATGRFTFKSEAGDFDVTIVKLTGGATPENPYVQSTNLLPQKYADMKTSGLKAKVEPGSSKNVYEFQLQGK